jgi:hypothetical protein
MTDIIGDIHGHAAQFERKLPLFNFSTTPLLCHCVSFCDFAVKKPFH